MTSTSHPIQITEVQLHQIPDVVDFVMQARAGMFPMLDATVMPDDLQHFANTYLNTRHGRFLIARQGDRLLGAIGYLPYDGRFSQLEYQGLEVVEVVRLFIDPAVRRLGLAGRLFTALKTAAIAQGIEVLYLHTHPFLPGAIAFWQRQGFAIIDVEDDPLWQTTHLQCLL